MSIFHNLGMKSTFNMTAQEAENEIKRREKISERIKSHCGKKFCFHGRFSDKAVAVAKERATPGAFIIEKDVKGETFYLVVTERKR